MANPIDIGNALLYGVSLVKRDKKNKNQKKPEGKIIAAVYYLIPYDV